MSGNCVWTVEILQGIARGCPNWPDLPIREFSRKKTRLRSYTVRRTTCGRFGKHDGEGGERWRGHSRH